jgi:hypothetical protein
LLRPFKKRRIKTATLARSIASFRNNSSITFSDRFLSSTRFKVLLAASFVPPDNAFTSHLFPPAFQSDALLAPSGLLVYLRVICTTIRFHLFFFIHSEFTVNSVQVRPIRTLFSHPFGHDLDANHQSINQLITITVDSNIPLTLWARITFCLLLLD